MDGASLFLSRIHLPFVILRLKSSHLSHYQLELPKHFPPCRINPLSLSSFTSMASFSSPSSSLPTKSHNPSFIFRSSLLSPVCRWWWWWSSYQSTKPRKISFFSSSSSSIFFLFFLLSSLLTFSVSSQPIPTLSIGSHPIPSSPSPSPSPIYLPNSITPNHHHHHHHHHRHYRITLAISLTTSATLLACLLIMAFIKFLKFKLRRKSRRVEDAQDLPYPSDSISSSIKKDNHKKIIINNPCSSSSVPIRFSWEEIETLTMKFSSSLIGEGGYSNVYLSHFSDSSLGALKIHTGSSERLNRMFKQELEILLHLKHDNIVNLLGYCDEREEGALLFEYVSKGNLHQKLHERESTTQEVTLSWKNRMLIAFQLAKAIEYLHEECKPQIIHGDIKSSNILLDDKLNCKLCDFGFSKMGFSSTVTRSSMTPLMGSPGYIDPLYLRTGIASKKNDVYSFGVIILEMITGIEAFSSEKEEILTCVAEPIIKDANRVAEMVDPKLRKAGDLGIIEEAKIMASISAKCLRTQSSLRPSMSEIIKTMNDNISF